MQQILYHAQEQLKQAHNKKIKPWSYALGNKIWLSSKHLRTKQNRKLKAKFFDFFWVLYPGGKKTYKFKLPKQWKIYNVFYVSLPEQNTMKKGQMNNKQLNFQFEACNNKEYKVEGIWDSEVYARESARQLPEPYYLVLSKSYLEEKNTWEPTLVIKHLWRFVISYHKDNPEKPTATFISVNTIPMMARPTAPPITRPITASTKKRDRLTKTTITTIK